MAAHSPGLGRGSGKRPWGRAPRRSRRLMLCLVGHGDERAEAGADAGGALSLLGSV